MNRLILIGNGFDLAHGMKTSFKDFISYYLEKALTLSIKKKYIDDPLIKIIWYKKPGTLNIKVEEGIEAFRYWKNKGNYVSISQSEFLEEITNDIDNNNWVDIESVYFRLLKNNLNNENEISKLNNELDHLKKELIEYLKKEEVKIKNIRKQSNGLLNCFTENFKDEEFIEKGVLLNIKGPKCLKILNFNYTNTIEYYEKHLISTGLSRNLEINYIHGNIDGSKGDPIFGYGDEFDKEFKTFEEKNNNKLFKHIKSFGYLQNKNYYNLIRFLESGNFQVQIYGHSCGLSDRTLLNKIFEHKYCRSIKIFYHEKDGENDFTERTHEIYRHFDNKDVLRNKIVSYESSKPMPQDMLVDRG